MESNVVDASVRLNKNSATSLLEEQKKSGLTFKAFCNAKNISHGRLNYWRNRLRKKAREEIKFVALATASPPARGAENAHVEFVMPSGVVLKVPANIDAACLTALLRAAREAA